MDFLNLSDAAIKAKNKKELLDFVFKLKESITEEYTMINMLLKLQNDLQELRSEVKELKESHTQSSDNTELEKHIHDLDQYQKRNNIEISGIPKGFEDNLEDKVIEVWNSLGFNEELKTSDIQACHRLDELSGASPTSPKKTIVRFVNRKHAEMLYSKRFEIKDADLSSTGIPENVNLYVNPNFCPYYKWLWMKCRKIKREGGVKYLWSRDGKIKMKRDDNSNTIQVNHLSVLQQNFPNFDFN